MSAGSVSQWRSLVGCRPQLRRAGTTKTVSASGTVTGQRYGHVCRWLPSTSQRRGERICFPQGLTAMLPVILAMGERSVWVLTA
jgi:hypothetical protein